jgi:hypothetical protein
MFIPPIELERRHNDVLAERLTHPDYWYTNCGGFALAGSGWYQPGDWNENETRRAYRTAEKNKNGWRSLEKKLVKLVQTDFPDLQTVTKDRIDNLEIDPEKYEIIAFRIRRARFFCDFHFMKCDKDGNWIEKKGHNKEISCHRYEDIYDIWGNYDGKIFFFTRERK